MSLLDVTVSDTRRFGGSARPADSDARIALPCLLIFVATVLYLTALLPLGLNPYDEGVRLYGAERVLAGELPYHDFFTYYAPGQFYWPAMLFLLFGKQILVARLGALLFVAIGAAAAFALCRRAGLDPLWSSLAAAALVLPIGNGSEFIICDPSLALVLTAGAVLVGTAGARSSHLVCGMLIGLAGVFRHDFAAYGGTAAVLTAFWSGWRAHGHPEASSLARARAATRRLLPIIGGILLIAVPVYGLLGLRGPGVLVKALLLDPPAIMQFRALPYSFELKRLYTSSVLLATTMSPDAIPIVAQTAVIVTPVLALLLALALLLPSRRRSMPARRTAGLLFLLVTASGLAVYALGRSDWYHIYPLHVVAACVITLVIAPDRTGARSRSRLIEYAVAAVVALVLVTTLATHVALAASVRPLQLPRAAHVLVPKRFLWIEGAVQDLWMVGDPGPIFVGAMRHDRVLANAVILYFLAERGSGTRFHAFDPAVTTRRDVQERIIEDLSKRKVRTAIVHTTGTVWDEPNKSRDSSEVFLLDQYLRAEFSALRQTGPYLILVRPR